MFDLKKVQSCRDSDGLYLEYKINGYKCLCQRYENDLQWLGALKKLENLVNLYYKIRENEMQQKQSEQNEVNDEVKTANMDDIMKRFSKPIKLSDSCFGTPPTNELNYEIRTKSLELACSLYNTAYYDRSEGNKPIIDIAKRFYDYITNGE